jgi:hypothetical protein
MRTIGRRSELRPEELRRLDAASDPADVVRSSDRRASDMWVDQMKRSSVQPNPTGMSVDALRALFIHVQRMSVATQRPADARPQGAARRETILKLSVD